MDKTTELVFHPENWWFMAVFLGATFISTFYLMGIATQKVGVTIATLANKMSMIIPVLFNLLVFKSTKDFDVLNFFGLVAAVVAIVLSNYSPKNQSNEVNVVGESRNKLLLPISIFFLGGVIDTSLSYSNLQLLQKGEEVVFPIALFATASVIGVLIILYNMFFKKEPFEAKSILAGIILGIPNYFSIYFLLMALTAFEGNGAFVLPVMSIGIIVVASMVSLLVLRDKLNKINLLGIAVAIVAILLLSYQKIGFI